MSKWTSKRVRSKYVSERASSVLVVYVWVWMYGGSIASLGSGTVLTANCRGIAVRERVYNWLQSLSNIGAFWAILGSFGTLSNVPVTYSPLVEWKKWKVACFPHFDSRVEREKWSRFEEIKFEEADHGNYISYELITRSSIKIFFGCTWTLA